MDLKDKLGKTEDISEIFTSKDNTLKEEALSALVMLGFTKKQTEKTIDLILKENKNIAVEGIIKEALKRL